jgi:soluble lytic murein transglycosylase-like protein
VVLSVLVTSRRLVALAVCAAVGLAAIPATAAPDPDGGPKAEARDTGLTLIERPGNRLERSIEAHLELVAEREARREARRERRQASAADLTEMGVPRSTLDAIASCESGGNPSAVNAAGYYGKYQFDLGTWQSVGGSGNPAEAPEPEQDYRAALLYSRAGSSPWPVCGS